MNKTKTKNSESSMKSININEIFSDKKCLKMNQEFGIINWGRVIPNK